MSRPIAELVAAGLRHAGVEILFGLPGGGSNLDVIGAAEAEGLRFVLAHSEGAAVLMAAAAAELTGRPGPSTSTSTRRRPEPQSSPGRRTASVSRPTSTRCVPRCGPLGGRSSSPASARRRRVCGAS